MRSDELRSLSMEIRHEPVDWGVWAFQLFLVFTVGYFGYQLGINRYLKAQRSAAYAAAPLLEANAAQVTVDARAIQSRSMALDMSRPVVQSCNLLTKREGIGSENVAKRVGCYLTMDTSRLCAANERAEVVTMVHSYYAARVVENLHLNESGQKPIPAIADSYNGRKIFAELKQRGQEGFISLADFGPNAPAEVRDAFAGVTAKPVAACKG